MSTPYVDLRLLPSQQDLWTISLLSIENCQNEVKNHTPILKGVDECEEMNSQIISGYNFREYQIDVRRTQESRNVSLIFGKVSANFTIPRMLDQPNMYSFSHTPKGDSHVLEVFKHKNPDVLLEYGGVPDLEALWDISSIKSEIEDSSQESISPSSEALIRNEVIGKFIESRASSIPLIPLISVSYNIQDALKIHQKFPDNFGNYQSVRTNKIKQVFNVVSNLYSILLNHGQDHVKNLFCESPHRNFLQRFCFGTLELITVGNDGFCQGNEGFLSYSARIRFIDLLLHHVGSSVESQYMIKGRRVDAEKAMMPKRVILAYPLQSVISKERSQDVNDFYLMLFYAQKCLKVPLICLGASECNLALDLKSSSGALALYSIRNIHEPTGGDVSCDEQDSNNIIEFNGLLETSKAYSFPLSCGQNPYAPQILKIASKNDKQLADPEFISLKL